MQMSMLAILSERLVSFVGCLAERSETLEHVCGFELVNGFELEPI
tara:strand:- start:298 stop:432 length:135 start_codon:yes stop_codon:yes gene_type:complete